MNKKVVILSAPSGSGKTTIARALLQAPLKLEFSISACSRVKRDVETDGVDYFFMTPQEFRQNINDNAFFEWEEVYADHFYGTLRSEPERIWKKGHFVLFDVDVYGGLNLKKQLGDQALSIFIQPPDLETLEERLVSRSLDTPDKIEMRLNKAAEEMAMAPRFDLVIINDHLDTAIEQSIEAIKAFLNQ